MHIRTSLFYYPFINFKSSTRGRGRGRAAIGGFIRVPEILQDDIVNEDC
jgi:hypothetical protein